MTAGVVVLVVIPRGVSPDPLSETNERLESRLSLLLVVFSIFYFLYSDICFACFGRGLKFRIQTEHIFYMSSSPGFLDIKHLKSMDGIVVCERQT